MARTEAFKVHQRMDLFGTRICKQYVNGRRCFRAVRVIDRYQFMMRRIVNAYYHMCSEYGQEMRGRRAIEEFNQCVSMLRHLRAWFWFKALNAEIPNEMLGLDVN